MKTRTIVKQRTARFINDPMSIPKIRRDIKRREGAIAAIAMKGDTFWNNGRTREFSTAQGLSEGYKSMDKTFHDLDHGANPGIGIHIRIEDIVGYHDFTEYNPATKEMIIYIYPEENMQAYPNWRAFMDLCERAGKNPNVSVEYMSTDIQQKASELGDLVDYKAAGFKDDDMIWVEQSYRFLGAATVNIGACNDSDGCGIINQNNEDNIGSCRVSTDADIKEKAEQYNCECVECGHKLKSDKHCRDIKCPECGGAMRRLERPGPGKNIDNDIIKEKKNMTEKVNQKEGDIEEQAVKDRKIEILTEKLQESGKLRADLELKLEEINARVKALEPTPVVVDEEKQALEARTLELEGQLKEAEEKLSKPVSRKTTSSQTDDESTGVKALRWFAHNKISFNTPIKGE